MLKPSRWLACLGLAALLYTSLQARASSAITLTAPGTVFASAPYSPGFEFTVLSPVDLLTLGVYDHLGDGLEAPSQVALWQGDATTPLLSAEVPAGTAGELDGGFRFVPVAAVRLEPGTTYVVAAYLDGGWATSFGLGQGGTAEVAPEVQLIADRFADGFFALAYPDQSDGAGQRAWLGANFQLAAVPEPASAVLALAGLLTLAARARRSPR